MMVIFLLLFFFALIGLLLGLIKPNIVIRWGTNKTRKWVALIYGLGALIFFILSVATAPSQKESPTKLPEVTPSRELTYEEKLPGFISFICSKPKGKETIYYYLIKDKFVILAGGSNSFPLPEKIILTDLKISTIQSPTGWDTESLCNPKVIFDLPNNLWEGLTTGSERENIYCGVGATMAPCDINIIDDEEGITGMKVRPQIKGYVSATIDKYWKKDGILKIVGEPVKGKESPPSKQEIPKPEVQKKPKIPTPAPTPTLTPTQIPTPILTPTPTPTETPAQPKATWQEVESWSGNGIKNTEPFNITGNQWRVKWENKGGEGIFQIFVFRPESEAFEDMLANTIEAESDTSYVYLKGTFYLKINAANTSWMVEVEELR